MCRPKLSGIRLFERSVQALFPVLAVFAILVGCGPRIRHGPRITSYANLYKIGTAIRDYTEDHGVRPQQLSNLVPKYIPLDQIGIFYVTNNYVQTPSIPVDWASNPSRVDQFSSYTYLGTNSVHEILAFEKTDLWKPGASHYGEVAVLFTDFHVQYFPTQKLRELISGKAPGENRHEGVTN
jgi:hypothetical protein